MSLSSREVQRVAERILADYDAGRPNQIFADRGTDWLTLEDAYAVQGSVAELRRKRGERCLGYKVGCLSPAIQTQLGINQPVRGYVWESEAYQSGCSLPPSRFANLSIEGEIAFRLSQDIPADNLDDDKVAQCIECWFPVIELHNNVFRGTRATSQELVAGNAMHAGFVSPFSSRNGCAPSCRSSSQRLVEAQITIEIDGDLVETGRMASLPRGPLGSVRWLMASLEPLGTALRVASIILTGSPGRLIPLDGSRAVTVTCEDQRVELFVEQHISCRS